jgi:hypothetical protein
MSSTPVTGLHISQSRYSCQYCGSRIQDGIVVYRAWAYTKGVYLTQAATARLTARNQPFTVLTGSEVFCTLTSHANEYTQFLRDREFHLTA